MSDDLRVAPSVASGVRDRLLAVRSLGILEGLDDDGALLLAEYSKVTTFQPGEEVTSADADASSVHIVLEGKLRVPRADGTSTVIDNGRGVGVIGAMSTDGRGFRSFAEERTRTLEISKDAFLAAMEESFSIARNVLKVFAGMLIDARGALPLPADDVPEAGDELERTEPRTLVERVLEVSRSGLFVDANVDAVFDLARVIRQLRVPAGHLFFRRGDPARATIRILAGTIHCTTPEGGAVIATPGMMLGGLAALAQRPHVLEARAETEVIAYEIQFEDFLVILEAHPELTMGLLQGLAKELLEIQ